MGTIRRLLVWLRLGGVLAVCAAAFAMRADIDSESRPSTMEGRAIEALFRFEPNEGQFPSEIAFVARGGRFDAAIDSAGLSLVDRTSRELGRLGLRLLGADRAARAEPDGKLQGHSNYLLGSDARQWKIGVPHYQRVRFRQIYPGTDIVYYANEAHELEYDFELAPHADVADLRLAVEGAESVRVTDAGELRITRKGSDLTLRKPIAYQEENGSRREVTANFTIDAAQEVGFALGQYDRRLPLIIDPSLDFSTYVQNSGPHLILMGQDAQDNVFLGGTTQNANFPTPHTLGSSSDAFVAKFDKSGKLQYATYIGGSGADEGKRLRVSADGVATLAGSTDSTDFPAVNAFQPKWMANGGPGSVNDLFIARLRADGSGLIFSSYIGGSEGESLGDLAIDSAGNAYVTGGTTSSDFPTTHAFQAAYAGGSTFGIPNADSFIIGIRADGSRTFASYLGGTGAENATAILTNGSAIYLAGTTTSKDFPLLKPLQSLTEGSLNIYLCKLATDGALLYSTQLGGSRSDDLLRAALLPDGSVVMTGTTDSLPDDFPLKNAFKSGAPGRASGTFLWRVNAVGDAFAFSTFLSDDGGESVQEMTVAGSDIFLAGTASASGLPVVNPVQANPSGLNDLFVGRFSSSGQPVFLTYLGGSANDGWGGGYNPGFGLAVDADGGVAVSSVTESDDFPTRDALQPHRGGDFDIFVARLPASGAPVTSSTYLGGSSPERAGPLAFDKSGALLVTGCTYSPDFPTHDATSDQYSGTNCDQFLAKLSEKASPGLIQFATNAYEVGENDGQALVTVTRSGGAYGAISATLTTRDFIATAGRDYTTVNTTVAFSDGDTAPKHIAIPITNNDVADGHRYFFADIARPTGGATIGSPSSTQIIIRDDDLPKHGKIGFESASYQVSEGAGYIDVKVVREDGSDGEVSVFMQTQPGTAKDSEDFASQVVKLTFADHEANAKIVRIPIIDDNAVESTESFGVWLSNSTVADTLGDNTTASITILDNDAPEPPDEIRFEQAAYRTDESAGDVALHATRTGSLHGDIWADVVISGGTAGARDYRDVVGVLYFPDGAALATGPTLHIQDDIEVEPDETVEFTIVPRSGNVVLAVPSTAVLTIADNDKPVAPNPGHMRLSSSAYHAKEADGRVAVTIEREGGFDGTATVVLQTADGQAHAGDDFIATTQTVQFADGDSAPRTIEIALLSDAVQESDETFQIRLESPTGASLSEPSLATVTIVDSTPPPSKDGGGALDWLTAALFALSALRRTGLHFWNTGSRFASCIRSFRLTP